MQCVHGCLPSHLIFFLLHSSHARVTLRLFCRCDGALGLPVALGEAVESSTLGTISSSPDSASLRRSSYSSGDALSIAEASDWSQDLEYDDLHVRGDQWRFSGRCAQCDADRLHPVGCRARNDRFCALEGSRPVISKGGGNRAERRSSAPLAMSLGDCRAKVRLQQRLTKQKALGEFGSDVRGADSQTVQ